MAATLCYILAAAESAACVTAIDKNIKLGTLQVAACTTTLQMPITAFCWSTCSNQVHKLGANFMAAQ